MHIHNILYICTLEIFIIISGIKLHAMDKGKIQTTNLTNNEPEELEIEDNSSGKDGITDPFNPNDVKIESPAFTIAHLIDRLEFDDINMQTEFQRRGNLWDNGKQSRLIESILLGLPLPAFYFDTSEEKWNIIDGLQRCCAIDNFCVKKELLLQDLEFLKDYEGWGYDRFDKLMKRKLLTCNITVHQLKKGSPIEVCYILFSRLNTGGTPLTPQEIRNAMFQGTVSDMIQRMATTERFKKATDYKVPTKRMEDQDLVSRFITFYVSDYNEYLPDLNKFINKSLSELKKNIALYRTIEDDFSDALQLAYDIFQDDAFRKRTDIGAKRSRINKAYFEVITVIFSKLSPNDKKAILKNKELLKLNLVELAKDSESGFINSVAVATGTRDSVLTRFNKFKEVVHLTLSNQTYEPSYK